MEKEIFSAPFAKTVETEDGGREVWGFASLELKDKSGEIADFNGTVKAFEKWSQDTEQRTGGKSKGNVRVMHQPITAGKTIHWEPTETTIKEDDGNEKTVKGIWVGAYVPPTKPDVIRDIDEGILSAFSIGGNYEKRWWSQEDNAFRYIPQLSEYSLVDNPCVPGADIMSVIQKADAPWNRKEGGDMSEEIKKEDAPKGGDNTMTKGEEKTMELDQVIKAAEAAGLNLEQVQAFFKALTPADQSPAPVSVSTIDGDGDEDKNKEFPNPNEHASNVSSVESDVKTSEEGSGVAEKSAEGEVTKADVVTDDDQPEDVEPEEETKCDKCGGMHKTEDCDMAEKSASAELKKEGKAVSKKNAAHMQHAANHIGAVMKGADYTAEDHLVVESQMGQGVTGEEAPEVDIEKMFFKLFSPVIEAVVSKSLETQLQKSAHDQKDLSKSFNELQGLVKGLATQADLQKAVGELEAVKALVKEIHETPQSGGPLLNGGNPAFMKSFSQVDVAQAEESTLEKFVGEIKDPILRDKVGQELAMRKMRQALR